MTEKRDVETAELSIWFFCGILMLAYGVVLVITGITELHNPPPTVLAEPASDVMVGCTDDALRQLLHYSFQTEA